jgi:multiple sugar transport system substrate-binding protein
MRRLFTLVVLGVMLTAALSLLAFGPRGSQVIPQNRIVVEYWEKWTGSEEQQMRLIVNDFNDTIGKQKGIYVRYLSTSAINQKALVATAAGVPPDIAGLWNGNIVQYAAQDALEPLEDLATSAGINAGTYKPVYWDACNYHGHLYGLVSTPAVVALLYNRLTFEASANQLRAAGLDPTRPPRTLDELDRYAAVLDKVDPRGRVLRAGYFPMEPGWYVPFTPMWFGATMFDEKTGKFHLTDPKTVAAFDWIASYSRKLGKDAASDFKSGFGNFDSPQNPFLTGDVAMEQQGPWMANYIDHLRPDMQRLLWPRAVEMTKPIAERRKNYAWAAAAFPSAVAGLDNVSYCTFDVLVIPRGAKHKREAFDFLAYVNRQDVMEKLCMLHCKNSPLTKVSDEFLNHHPNPYIGVYEELARSPNAMGCPQVPIWQEVVDELTAVGQAMSLLKTDALPALQAAQDRLQLSYDLFVEKQKSRESRKSSS